jgi:hypothetical protein
MANQTKIVYDKLGSILQGLFGGAVPVHYDMLFKEREFPYFNIRPVNNEFLQARIGSGETRQHTFEVKYYKIDSGDSGKEVLDDVCEKAEQVKSTINSNRGFDPSANQAWTQALVTNVEYQTGELLPEEEQEITDLVTANISVQIIGDV